MAEVDNDTLSTDRFCATLSIVSHGDSKRVLKLLDSLYVFEPEKHFEIIITDNFGQDLPDLHDAKGNSVTIIRNERPQGFARNHNQAFQQARAKIFCVLNPDVIFTQEIFGRLTSLLESSQADIVAPLIVDSRGGIQDSFRMLPTPVDVFRRKLPGYHFSPIRADVHGLARPDWIAGIFLMLKSETFRQINGFDERYYLYFEDVDLCTRATLLNLKLLVDTNIQVQHDAQRASRKNPAYLFWHLQSAIRFYRSDTYKRARRREG